MKRLQLPYWNIEHTSCHILQILVENLICRKYF